MATSQSVPVDFEVCLRPSALDKVFQEMRARKLVIDSIVSHDTFHDGELAHSKELDELVSRITVYGITEANRNASNNSDMNANGNGNSAPPNIPFWMVAPRIILYRCVDTPCDAPLIPFSTLTQLPSARFDRLWDSLQFGENQVKQRLLSYLATGALFRKMQVRSSVVSWHGIALLYGPPGSGKTTMCRALAQKLAIRSSLGEGDRTYLVEVQASSLYSMYFGQSEKNIETTFTALRNLAKQPSTNHVFVLLDEVESLASVRSTESSNTNNGDGNIDNGNGNSNTNALPGDAMRSVNALLTSLDTLREVQNITVLATSNLLSRIDPAFLDRVDIHERIPQPGSIARRNIIQECVAELKRTGILEDDEDENGADTTTTNNNNMTMMRVVAETVESTEGLSGRTLRKLPLIAHAEHLQGIKKKSSQKAFLKALQFAAANAKECIKSRTAQ